MSTLAVLLDVLIRTSEHSNIGKHLVSFHLQTHAPGGRKFRGVTFNDWLHKCEKSCISKNISDLSLNLISQLNQLRTFEMKSISFLIVYITQVVSEIKEWLRYPLAP